MTTRLRQPMLSPPKSIPIQSLLYKMTTGLTYPGTTFFVPLMKKKLVYNNRCKTLSSEEMVYIYSIATLYCKVYLMFIKTGHLHLRFSQLS